MHPILNALTGTRDQWLVDLLYAFNRGDLEKFETHKQFWAQQVSHFTDFLKNLNVDWLINRTIDIVLG